MKKGRKEGKEGGKGGERFIRLSKQVLNHWRLRSKSVASPHQLAHAQLRKPPIWRRCKQRARGRKQKGGGGGRGRGRGRGRHGHILTRHWLARQEAQRVKASRPDHLRAMTQARQVTGCQTWHPPPDSAYLSCG